MSGIKYLASWCTRVLPSACVPPGRVYPPAGDVIALYFTDLHLDEHNVGEIRHLLRKNVRNPDDYVYNEEVSSPPKYPGLHPPSLRRKGGGGPPVFTTCCAVPPAPFDQSLVHRRCLGILRYPGLRSSVGPAWAGETFHTLFPG